MAIDIGSIFTQVDTRNPSLAVELSSHPTALMIPASLVVILMPPFA